MSGNGGGGKKNVNSVNTQSIVEQVPEKPPPPWCTIRKTVLVCSKEIAGLDTSGTTAQIEQAESRPSFCEDPLAFHKLISTPV